VCTSSNISIGCSQNCRTECWTPLMFIPTDDFAWLLYLCYWWREIKCKFDWIPSPSLLYQCHENLSHRWTVNSRLHIQPLTQTCVSIQTSLASLHISRTAPSFLSVLTQISAWLFHIHFISHHCYVFYTHLPIWHSNDLSTHNGTSNKFTSIR